MILTKYASKIAIRKEDCSGAPFSYKRWLFSKMSGYATDGREPPCPTKAPLSFTSVNFALSRAKSA
jgi:hypothetical protein